MTYGDVLCKNTLGRIVSSSVKHDSLCHCYITLTFAGSYNAAECQVLVALLHLHRTEGYRLHLVSCGFILHDE